MRKGMAVVVGICAVALMALPLYAATGTITLPSGKTLQVTDQQLAKIKEQQGVTFSQTKPELQAGQVMMPVSAELGGGYLVAGSTAAVATALNAVGVTVGLTAAAVGAGITAGAAVGITLGVAAGAAAIGAAASSGSSGEGSSKTPTHH